MNNKSSKQAIRMNDGIGVMTEHQKLDPAADRDIQLAIRHEINPSLMRDFDERWEEPESCSRAVEKCMLVIAQLRSHDPLLVCKATGFPLDFVRSVIYFLLGNEVWIGWSGYVGLLCSLHEYPNTTEVFEECENICDLMWDASSRSVIDCEWRMYSSVAITTAWAENLYSTHSRPGT